MFAIIQTSFAVNYYDHTEIMDVQDLHTILDKIDQFVCTHKIIA